MIINEYIIYIIIKSNESITPIHGRASVGRQARIYIQADSGCSQVELQGEIDDRDRL